MPGRGRASTPAPREEPAPTPRVIIRGLPPPVRAAICGRCRSRNRRRRPRPSPPVADLSRFDWKAPNARDRKQHCRAAAPSARHLPDRVTRCGLRLRTPAPRRRRRLRRRSRQARRRQVRACRQRTARSLAAHRPRPGQPARRRRRRHRLQARRPRRSREGRPRFGRPARASRSCCSIARSSSSASVRPRPSFSRHASAIGKTPADDETQLVLETSPPVMLEQALVDEARAAIARADRLRPTGAMTDAEYETFVAQLKTTQARYQSALNAVREQAAAHRRAARRPGAGPAAARRRGDRRPLRRPSGRAAASRPAPTCKSARRWSRSCAIDRLRFTAGVPESQASRVDDGQPIEIRVAGIDEPIAAEVTRVSPMVVQSSRSVRIEADVPNDDLELQAGLFAEAEIIVDAGAQALAVPRRAVIAVRRRAKSVDRRRRQGGPTNPSASAAATTSASKSSTASPPATSSSPWPAKATTAPSPRKPIPTPPNRGQSPSRLAPRSSPRTPHRAVAGPSLRRAPRLRADADRRGGGRRRRLVPRSWASTASRTSTCRSIRVHDELPRRRLGGGRVRGHAGRSKTPSPRSRARRAALDQQRRRVDADAHVPARPEHQRGRRRTCATPSPASSTACRRTSIRRSCRSRTSTPRRS